MVLSLILCAQDARLTKLVNELRDEKSLQRREDVQQQIEQLLRSAKELRGQARDVVAREGDSDTRERVQSALLRSPWRECSAVPVRNGYDYQLLSFGSHALLWGAGRYEPDGKKWSYLNEAWLIDPAGGEWKKIDAPPIEWRRDPHVACVGGRLVLWGGKRGTVETQSGVSKMPDRAWEEQRTFGDGAIWDGHKWVKMAESTLQPPWSVVAWVDDKLFIWGGLDLRRDGAIWNVETNAWTKVPDAPFEPRVLVHCVASSGQVWIWGGRSRAGEDKKLYPGKSHLDGAIYDLSKGTWEKIPQSSLTAEAYAVVTLDGTRLFVWGGAVFADGKVQPTSSGAYYERSSRTWSPLGAAPLEPGYHYATYVGSGKLYIWGGHRNEPWRDDRQETTLRGAMLDLATGKWEQIASCPLGSRVRPNLSWVGDRLLVWGGTAPQGPCDVAKADVLSDGATLDLTKNSWTKFQLGSISGSQPSVQVRHGEGHFHWVDSTWTLLSIDVKEGPRWKVAPVNQGAVWRDGTWQAFDGSLVIKDQGASATWVAPRLIVYAHGTGRIYVLEPFE